MTLRSVRGGPVLSSDDEQRRRIQKCISKEINDSWANTAVAVPCKPLSKEPVDASWVKAQPGDFNFISWLDDENTAILNAGLGLRGCWLDVDIDGPDPEFPRFIFAAFKHVGIDVRLAYGRESYGVPTHALIKLDEDTAAAMEYWERFEPKKFTISGQHYRVELRAPEYNNKEATKSQSVMPGSVYPPKDGIRWDKDVDLVIWYGQDGKEAKSVSDIIDTGSHRTEYRLLLRGVAFGIIAYSLRHKWNDGTSRHDMASVLSGWLARLVMESSAINTQEGVGDTVFCPINSDEIALSVIEFITSQFGDDESWDRLRTYRDASKKLALNPEARIAGWPALQQLVGPEYLAAIRAAATPGADLTQLTILADRYVYDESCDSYIDIDRHKDGYGNFTHKSFELDKRHCGESIWVGKKLREIFPIFERSKLRKRVGLSDMLPQFAPSGIYRIGNNDTELSDDDESRCQVIFNTWRGWPVLPIPHSEINVEHMAKCLRMLDELLGLITQHNPDQIDWLKKWVAWTFQYPAIKQQISPVIVGGQGVGKTFFGEIFLKAIFSHVWGQASSKVLDTNFAVTAFKNNMITFIDEANFNKNPQAVDEVKKLIRNVRVSGEEKFQNAGTYRIYSRIIFASNKQNTGISDKDVRDRALFHIKSVDAHYKGMMELEFREWADTLKAFFDEFEELLRDGKSPHYYVRFFMDLPCTRAEIESLKYSSGNDSEIATANMSWAMRIVKRIMEYGWIAYSDLAWEQPFDRRALEECIKQHCEDSGYDKVKPDSVIAEFDKLGMFEPYKAGAAKIMRPRLRWGSACELFTKATSVVLEPYREFDENDYGPNLTEYTDRPKRKGAKPSLF